jgi:AcrR family transcriptional regulator
METEKSDTQSKMVATAIDMIGRQVNLNFTIREFAEQAGVNLASVNYYFRSKDNLIDEVERHFMRELRKTYDGLRESEFNPKTRIVRWAERLMQQLMEYPGMLFLMVTKLISGGRQSAGVIELIDSSEQLLAPIIRSLTGMSPGDPGCSHMVMQLVAGVVTPILFHHGIGKTFGMNVSDPAERSDYIELLVNSILD